MHILKAADIPHILPVEVLAEGLPQASVRELLIDSRPAFLPKGGAFFALVSARNNGHKYLAECHAKGVRVFIVSERPTVDLPNSWIFRVSDTLHALQGIAAWHRRQFAYPVVGITGSNGKTIVKELLAQMLAATAPVAKSPLSYNSQVGVPLSLWGLGDMHQYAVIEAGISTPGEMERLAGMIAPTLGIFTHLGAAHDEGFASRREKFDEKMLLFAHAQAVVAQSVAGPEGAWLQEAATQYGFTLIGWRRTAADVRQDATIQASIEIDGDPYHFTIPAEGMLADNAINAAVALLALGFDQDAVQERLGLLQHLGMRLEWKEGLYGMRLLDDTWNNDLDGLEAALRTLGTYVTEGQPTTLILTDLLESGMPEKELYAQVAQMIVDYGIGRLIAIGPALARQQALFANATHYASTESALASLDASTLAGNLVLLKGARKFGLERLVQRLEKTAHHTRLEVDLNAVAANLNFYKSRLAPGVRVMAMVKAGAYGAGSFEIARLLQHLGVAYLAVAYPDEGVELRRNGITLPIAVMNVSEADFDLASRHQLEPMLYSLSILSAWGRYAATHPSNLPIHLELNTGMNRLGLDAPDLPAALELVQSYGLRVATVFSHLAAADDPGQDAFTRSQFQAFAEGCALLAQGLSQPFLRHIANTAGAARFTEMQLDMVRLGIGLYGVEVGGTPAGALQPVGAFKSVISQIRRVPAGQSVSYGHRSMLAADATIATVAVGYADGLPRSAGHGRYGFSIGGRTAPTVGAVCMDMTMVDVTGLPVQEGDEVIVFDANATLSALANLEQTIPYEILTRISERVKRVYVSR